MGDARADFMACSACLRTHGNARDRFRCAGCGRVVCGDEVLGGRHLVHVLPHGRLRDCGAVVRVETPVQSAMFGAEHKA